jgi:hypothetical protein
MEVGFDALEQHNRENALLYCKSSNIQYDLKRKSNGEPNKLFWELPIESATTVRKKQTFFL